jgi:CPA1 family monovalent cation:H+ antiporter
MDIPLLIRDLALLILIALIVIIISRKLAIPYTLGLVIAGLGFGFLNLLPEVRLTPDLVLFVFLPPLIFEGAWNVNFKLLRENWRVIFFLAGPGLLLSLAIIAGLLHVLDHLDWLTALLLAAILSPTDPIAVLGLFKQLHVNERLSLIIEGESLFNDGVAGSLYQVFLALVILATQGQHLAGRSALGTGILQFVIEAGGGLLIGSLAALLISQALDSITDPLIETTATLFAAYGIFWLADTLHTSAIMAVIVAGLIMGNYARNKTMSEQAREDVNTFWNIIAFLANALIFLMIGLQFQPFTLSLFQGGNLQTWIICIIAIGVVLLSRLLLVSVLTLQTRLKLAERLKLPNAERLIARRLPYSWQFIVFWSGLRGALSLALVLAIPTNVPTRNVLIISTYAVVLFTLLVQGLSLRWVLRRFLSPTSKEHQHDTECDPNERVIESV